MARDTSPQCKQCRREGQKLFLKGERCFTDKCGVERRSYPPGEHGRGRMRQSEYRVQLREAGRAATRCSSQFRAYYDKASRQDGVTGENLLRLLGPALDNVLDAPRIRRLAAPGWQLVGAATGWSGRRVDVPSYQVRPRT
jgi:small subunit ribosomal protein S4